MGSKARPKWVSGKGICVKCGRKEILGADNKCRVCNPESFYKLYPPTKR